MCGICGELTFQPGLTVSPSVVVAMRDRLVHRGPDDCGAYIAPSARASLGFRRLRIIDLSAAANQPMANEDGTVRVAFNGEIYNFLPLRRQLEARGHQFRTHSDTEVIVHLYEERGADFVQELDGMFAIAVWDDRQRRLVLARDRPGKKPLYYYRDDRRIVFGSEIKALAAHPDVPLDIDPAVVPRYFMHGYVPAPSTFYRSIRQVPPASVVTIDADGTTKERAYWRLEYPDAQDVAPIERGTARERVRTLVTEAVERRLMSDVPLGTFLSAGIDSTIVVGVMTRLIEKPVRTFTIGFEGQPEYDETSAARGVAERFGTEHTEFLVKPSAVQLVDKLIWHHDGPFGDSSAIPTYLVSELTRPHVTVVLTGDGGDELFAGYVRFRAALAADRFPRGSGALLAAALRLLPSAPNERHPLARARRFARFMHAPVVERAARWTSIFPDAAVLLQDDVLGSVELDPLEHVRDRLESVAGASPLARLLAVNFASYLPDDLLVKTDRCTMANSIEARAPLLDTALAEYAASLPDGLKLSGGRGKAILREAFADLLPPEIDRRPKTGFGVPLDAWFRGELRDYAHDTLLSSTAASRGLLRTDVVERIVEEHERGTANHGHRLWSLVCFERWLQLLPGWRAGRTAAILAG